MCKAKNILVVLLALGIIAACAALPLVASAFHDKATMGQLHYETAPNVQLQIREESDTPAMAKLAMMYRRDGGIEISESMASMNREEAEARSLSILQEYIDAGLVETYDPIVHASRCMLATVTEDASLNGVYWMVVVVCADEDNYAQFDIAIDDENGYLLAVSYASERVPAAAKREKQLAAFADLYFTSLGMADYGDFATRDLEKQYIGENVCGRRYRFGDTVYGEVNVDLYVHEYGFYTEFPDL